MFCCNCGQPIGDAYIKRLIREELAHLDPDTANKLTDQVATRLGTRVRMQGQVRTFETKQSQEDGR